MHDILKAGFVESLVWEGDELVDWVNGGMRFRLDGSAVESRVRYGYRFDAVCASNGYAVIYERLGTKGLILRNGVILREISRSFYRADDYEYPICLWTGSQGRTLMAHCPEEYNRIEIDDVQTGERLTGAGDREPSDFFHSSLQASPGGTRLLSAGWIWSPWETVCFFDVSQALRDPRHLDDAKHDGKRWPCGSVEESSACWQTEDRILIAGNVDDFFDQEEQPEVRLGPNNIMVCDVSAASCIRTVPG